MFNISPCRRVETAPSSFRLCGLYFAILINTATKNAACNTTAPLINIKGIWGGEKKKKKKQQKTSTKKDRYGGEEGESKEERAGVKKKKAVIEKGPRARLQRQQTGEAGGGLSSTSLGF